MAEEEQPTQGGQGFGQEAQSGRFQRAPREQFETIKIETINYGTNNFIEIAKKKASNGNLFISISKGWYPANSTEKRYKAGIGFPMEKDIIDRFTSALNTVLQE